VFFCFGTQGTATIKPGFVAPTETLEKSLESSTSTACSVGSPECETPQPFECETGADTQGKLHVDSHKSQLWAALFCNVQNLTGFL
jgi:hypothetical protein